MTASRRPAPRAAARGEVRPGVPRIGARKPVKPALSPRLGRPHVRLRVSVVVTLVALSVLGGRLVQLQGLDATAYAAQGEAQRTRPTTLPAVRGAITDRWGKVLSVNVETRLIAIDPTLLKDEQKDGAASALAATLGVAATTLRPLLDTTLADGKPSRYVVLARGLDVTAARAALVTKMPGSSLTVPGLVADTEETRDHPGGTVAAQVVGVTSRDGHALSGIEYTEDKVLAGTPGKAIQEVDPAGRVIPEGVDHITPAVQGSDVRLTIDRDVQFTAQTVLDTEVKNTGARGGDIVVEDPRSGEILAIASSPGFDASQWATGRLDPGVLTLPAVSNVYEPGSVNKVITAAAALDTGALSPNSEVTVEPQLFVPGRSEPINDAEVHGTEHLTFTGVLAQSSNIGTVHIAQRIGSATVYKYLKAFGLGSYTHAGLPGESPGLLKDVKDWNASNAATIPFGQGMSVTALQIASVYATIANGGVRVPPTIVRGIVKPDGSYIPATKPAAVRVVSKQAATTLSAMLESVTTADGTAPAAAIPGYRVAGKTGTAQAVTKGVYDGGFVSSFAGFAPADNPRLVVSVVLDHPTNGYFGGTVAAPVFRSVMGFALRSYKIAPTATRRPALRLTYDATTGTTPPATTGPTPTAPTTPTAPVASPSDAAAKVTTGSPAGAGPSPARASP